jgi:hypothetical protein
MLHDSDTASYLDMGATLLSEQPLTPKEQLPNYDDNWTALYNQLESSMNSKRSWRWSWWSYWSVLAEYFLPRRYNWVVTPNRMSRGSPINGAIIDSTGAMAVRTCAAGLWSGLTSPSRPWFKLGIALPWVDLDADGQDWLADTEQRLYTVLAQSNFYDIMAQAFQDVVVFGTAPVVIYSDFEDVVRFYLPCAGEYYLAVGSRLTVDTFDREFTLTVKQIVEQFQLENCPTDVRTMWRNGGASLDYEYVVRHCIEPNFAIADPKKPNEKLTVLPGMFTYREVYWLRGIQGDRPLSKTGFQKKPFMVARWATTSNDPYGRSPCMDALGDNKQVQQETKRKAEFIEKGVRPPMGANPELKNEPSSIIPGDITYTSTDGGKKGFWPLFEPNPAWLAALTTDIDKVNARIESGLFVNVFMAISRMEGVQPRNELELTKRDLERLQELGPFISKFETEYADIAIAGVLDIMQRRRMLKPMPKSLVGVPLKFGYQSIMRMAQQSSEAVGMKDFFQTVGVLSSAAKAAGVPDPIRTVNLDKSTRRYGEATNFPPDLFFTDQEVAQHDKIRMQEQQNAQGPQQALAAVQAAKTMADTSMPGGGSALGAMLGQGGGP